MKPYYEDEHVQIWHGDCREVIKTLADSSVDSVVCDPPYELGFMGKGWDRSGIAYDVAVWSECLRVLKPGGHLLAFGGSRTYHRLACAIEDAGFEIRDQIQWIYGSGFPKSLDVSKAIDASVGEARQIVGERKHSGNHRIGTFENAGNYTISLPASDPAKQWNGWGTALKPAHEPIVLARKPLIGTVAENVLQHGTGGLNIDGCRVETDWSDRSESWKASGFGAKPTTSMFGSGGTGIDTSKGRWPANVITSYSEDEYGLRSSVTPEQKKELFKWLYGNA
jgi:site-specific DNA-methyltransferase (adenine-specific)